MKGFKAFFELLKTKEGLSWNYAATEGPGGSYCGVTRATFEEYQKETSEHSHFSHADFGDNSTEDDIVLFDFYYWYLITKGKLACIPDWLVFPVADWKVQSGAWAIKPLQERAGLTGKDVDGLIGPGTIAAFEKMFAQVEQEIESNPDADADFVNWYCDRRKEFMTNWLNRSGNMDRLGKGIYARLKKIRNLALLQCESDDDDIVDIPKKIDDPDEPAEVGATDIVKMLDMISRKLDKVLDRLKA